MSLAARRRRAYRVGVDGLTRLIAAARTGDQGALEALVGAAYEQVWRLCASLVDREAAEDLAQETFLRAVRALSRYRGDAAARTWLLSIARRVCMDELRSRVRRRRRDGSLADRTRASDFAFADDGSEHALVTDLLGCLEPDRRAAFVLTQMIGLSYDEAAQVCECAIGTIRSRVARARVDLVQLIARSDRDSSKPRRPGWSSA